MREVETQLCRRDERALLVDVVAEDVAQGVVEDVRCGVVVAEGPATELLDCLSDGTTHCGMVMMYEPHRMTRQSRRLC